MLHLRENTGQLAVIRKSGCLFFAIFAKEIQRHFDAGPVCRGQLERVDRFYFRDALGDDARRCGSTRVSRMDCVRSHSAKYNEKTEALAEKCHPDIKNGKRIIRVDCDLLMRYQNGGGRKSAPLLYKEIDNCNQGQYNNPNPYQSPPSILLLQPVGEPTDKTSGLCNFSLFV